ncbi:conserved hypothetical protein [Pseudomonas sp. 8AS]|uniref:DUF1326 domain-containing protein n=1 Tax=Pseudomonas sp. 8AS TaxID=2653163 RepID=UPI0012F25DD9|nr:DUF1326 domain-containing protein [Pseudomonas sp. 8AS]VXC17368.1 conserved hypothetical protein [Pseudomonas sp. 8AS]
MKSVEWYIDGVQFGSCNCIYACPCQFEGLPSQGHCRGFEVLRVERGHFAEVELAGLQAAILYAWPGPIFEGRGEMQLIIDERADAAQRAALGTVLQGGETSPGATHWWVFHAMSETVHAPLFLPIDFSLDIAARSARVSIAGVLESVGRPILSPATGEEHRVRIDIPAGIEFELAEIGRADTRARAAIELDLQDSYGQFNRVWHSRDGVVHAPAR